jgi:hypothetical protein
MRVLPSHLATITIKRDTLSMRRAPDGLMNISNNIVSSFNDLDLLHSILLIVVCFDAWDGGGRRMTAATIIDRCVSLHAVEINSSCSSSSLFATSVHSNLALLTNKPRGASPRRHLCTFRILITYYFVPYIMPLCHFAIPPFRHSAIPPFRSNTQ